MTGTIVPRERTQGRSQPVLFTFSAGWEKGLAHDSESVAVTIQPVRTRRVDHFCREHRATALHDHFGAVARPWTRCGRARRSRRRHRTNGPRACDCRARSAGGDYLLRREARPARPHGISRSRRHVGPVRPGRDRDCDDSRAGPVRWESGCREPDSRDCTPLRQHSSSVSGAGSPAGSSAGASSRQRG